MSNWKTIAASAAIINVTCAYAAEPATPVAEPGTANAVSLDPDAPNSYLVFAPELDKTLARMPQLDPVTGLHVKEAIVTPTTSAARRRSKAYPGYASLLYSRRSG